MGFMVQELSVDGSHLHAEVFEFPESARLFADRLAVEGAGSPWLCAVRVIRSVSGREIYRARVEDGE